jgi:hypothetical protein
MRADFFPFDSETVATYTAGEAFTCLVWLPKVRGGYFLVLSEYGDLYYRFYLLNFQRNNSGKVLRQENEGATGHGKLRGHRKPQNLAYDV